MKSTTDFLLEFAEILKPIDKHIYNGEVKELKQMFLDKLEKYSLTKFQAEKLLGVQTRTLDAILDKSAVRVDSLNLFKLAQFLGLPINDFITLYINELHQDAIKEIEIIRRNVFILANFDIKNLKKAKFLTPKSDFDKIEKRIVKFFGLKNIYEYAINNKYILAFSRTKRSPQMLMREFWVSSAIAQFNLIANPNPYSREALLDLMPKIRPYTMNVENGLKNVIRALFHAGITVIYQPHLPTIQVRGATFIINKKPCIALTDLNKNYATIWFALLHELHHVLYDFDQIEKQTFHLTGEIELFLIQENEANEFARAYLFSKEKSKVILPNIQNHYVVSTYAKEAQVHPAIIYSFYSYDMEKSGRGNYWGKFKEYYPDVRAAIKDLEDARVFDSEVVQASVNYIKEKVFNI